MVNILVSAFNLIVIKDKKRQQFLVFKGRQRKIAEIIENLLVLDLLIVYSIEFAILS